MLVLTKDGVVFCMGDNLCGGAGDTTFKIVRSPLHHNHRKAAPSDLCNEISVLSSFIDQGIRISDIECGDTHSIFLGNDGTTSAIFGAGSTNHCELGSSYYQSAC